jgi:hypothetical protein
MISWRDFVGKNENKLENQEAILDFYTNMLGLDVNIYDGAQKLLH